MLSRIPWDQNIEADAIRDIFKVAVEGPEALMEVYTCHKRAISSLILESPPTWMTAMEWVWAQKADPVISQVTTWIEDGKLSTMKVSEEMSQEVKQYLRQKGQLCLKEGILFQCISQTPRDHSELQFLVPSDYRLEAMHGAHNDVGHLGLEWMLDILCDRFYWPNMEVDATCHVHTCEWCLRFKSKQDKAEHNPLLVTYTLMLVHMDFLTIENPHTGVDMNVLVITDHFMWHAKAMVTPSQSTKPTVTAFWNEFITNYSFPEKLLMDQGCSFESQLIKELCKLAQKDKVQTMPYHPETNDQCERCNQMLINMIGTLESNDNQHWKDYLPTSVHAYNCIKNNTMDFSPYHLIDRSKHRLPIDIKFGLMSLQIEEYSHNRFVAKLSTQLWQCYEVADRHRCKESTCHKQWYDWKMRASRLQPGDLWQKVFTGKHKKGDHWENTKYMDVEWQHNLPVYTINPWQGEGWIWIVHRNLLMHIAPCYQQERIQSESEDSDYNPLPGHVRLSELTLSTTGPVTWSQTKAHQLAQSIQDAWPKAVQYVQWR